MNKLQAQHDPRFARARAVFTMFVFGHGVECVPIKNNGASPADTESEVTPDERQGRRDDLSGTPRMFARARAVFTVFIFDDGIECVQTKNNMVQRPVEEPARTPDEPHVVEWSFDQGCFHIQSLAGALQCNLRSFLENRRTSYMPLLICPSSSEAHEACAQLQLICDNREGRLGEDEA